MFALALSAFAYNAEVAAASACTCGFANGRFTLATMTIDGTLTDWSAVKADNDNNVCDANSTSAPTELGGADSVADSPANVGRDLTWFAFTWDVTNVYFFTERAGGSSNIQRFVYYGDTNNDGLMQTGEPAVLVSWQGSNRNVIVSVGAYLQAVSGGDSLADTSGVADGYTMPGTVPSNTTLRNGTWGAADGLTMEFAVSWTELGLSGPTAIRFHVSSMNASFNSGNPPGGIEDNMAGCGGGTGSTQFADVAVTTPNTITAPHGTLTCSRFTVTNNGNANDSFELTNSIGAFSGAGGGTPTISYFYDTNANNAYDVGTDLAVANTTGAASLDTGTMTPLATRNIFECALATAVNAYTPSGNATVTTTFTSNFSNLVTAANTTTVTVLLLPNITVTKSSVVYSDPTIGVNNPPTTYARRIPGSFVDYTITATNTGGGALTSNTSVFTDPIPTNTELFVNSLGGSPTNSPVTQTNGALACGLTLSFSAAGTQTLRLADQTDGVNFATNAGPGYTYTASPTADGNGASTAVTAIRIAPTGTFAGASASGNPSCSWTFRVRVK